MLLLACASALRAAEADLSALWAERVACVVAVEYTVQTDTERRESFCFGTVIDKAGTVILPSAAINLIYSPDQLRNFKAYVPGSSEGVPAEYLGVDALSGWHFLKAGPSLLGKLRPVTAFAAATPPSPVVAEELWGIGLRGKEEDFLPYLLTGRVAMVNSLPQRTGISQHELASPGLPVFNARGEFAGLALASFGQSFVQFSSANRGGSPVMLVNVEESSAFLTAAECQPQFARTPPSLTGRPLAWLGTYGLQPVDTEAARFLGLPGQSAAIVSEVLEESPAERAGMKERDIIVAIDGKPLPLFKPDRVVTTFIDREVDRRRPGDEIALTILRDGKRVELSAVLANAPKLTREAVQVHFDRAGLTLREFVYSDAVVRRVKTSPQPGVIAHFVKPGSPAAAAGLQPEDWIREIDGTEPASFEQAVQLFTGIERDTTRGEYVLLISRGGETSVLRVKLK
jgi:serine protease Do